MDQMRSIPHELKKQALGLIDYLFRLGWLFQRIIFWRPIRSVLEQLLFDRLWNFKCNPIFFLPAP